MAAVNRDFNKLAELKLVTPDLVSDQLNSSSAFMRIACRFSLAVLLCLKGTTMSFRNHLVCLEQT